MTPELKKACERVFQEHKLSNQIKWNKDSFKGQIPIGLSALAKETLVKKKIIFLPDKSKKIVTLLNPAVASASTFEEAEGMIENKIPVPAVKVIKEQAVYIPQFAPDAIRVPSHSAQMAAFAVKSPVPGTDNKWYLKPVFYYFLLPTGAAVAGVLICFFLDFAYSELFLHTK